jgi:predicted DNA-binding helix-hairpin-helix protein
MDLQRKLEILADAAKYDASCAGSGIIQSADYTMEQVIEAARRLREEHDFRG